MGCDITPIGNHKLNTTNVVVLAKGIHERLSVNVRYGYYAHIEYNKLLNTNFEDSFIELGKYCINTENEFYTLEDEFYQQKQLVEKFGKEIVKTSKYYYYLNNDLSITNDIIEEELSYLANGGAYCLEVINTKESNSWIDIYQGNYVNHAHYYCRWWAFCEYFNDYPNTHNSYDNLHNFRKNLLYYAQKFGGDKIYYVNDQCTELEGVGQGSEYSYSWDALKNFILDKSKIINASELFLNKDYMYSPDENHYKPIAIVDDFKDLIY